MTRVFDEPVLNLREIRVQVVDEAAPEEGVHLSVDIRTRRSVTSVTLVPAAATGVAPIALRDSGRDLTRSYDANSVPTLGGCRGRSPEGPGTLIIENRSAQDVSRIRGLTLEFTLGRIEGARQVATDGRVAVGAW